jgi:hemolysin III
MQHYFTSIYPFLAQTLGDGGNYYAETDIKYIIVEPWNALSSLSFWIPVFYWAYQLKGKYQKYPFLTSCMPLLFLGGLGSALFHAFRTSQWLLLMDVLPILILTAAISFYFWYQVIRNWLYVAILFIFYAALQSWQWYQPMGGQATNVMYLARGVMIFLPAVLLLRQIEFHYVWALIGAMAWFSAAITFRYLDFEASAWMYMGSHWLWHISTAFGAHYLALFLYQYVNWLENKTAFYQDKLKTKKIH